MIYGLRLVQAHQFKGVRERLPARSPQDVYAFMAPIAAREVVEIFWILALDAQHKIVRNAPIIIATGTVNSAFAHPREVFRAAIVAGASAVILVHNHPSGEPTPSAEDRALTEQLVAGGKLLGIPVHDHIVIGHERYVSFAETGLL